MSDVGIYDCKAVQNCSVGLRDPPGHNATYNSLYYVTVEYYTNRLWIILAPIIMILGIVGNTLAIILLNRKDVGYLTSSPYLKSLTLVDTIVLLTGLLRHWIKETFGLDIRNLTNFECKVHLFSLYSCVYISVWLLVGVTVDRFVAIRFPLKARLTNAKQRCRIVISIFGTFFTLNAHFLFGVHLVIVKNQTVYSCKTDNVNYDRFLDYAFLWIDSAVFCFFPFVIIVSCNIGIFLMLTKLRQAKPVNVTPSTSHQSPNDDDNAVCRLHENAQNQVRVESLARKNMQGGQDPEIKSAETKRRVPKNLTVLLMTLNTVFLITTAPISIYFLVETYMPPERDRDSTQKIKLKLAFMIVSLLSYVNNAVNFYLYLLTGPRIRMALLRLLGCQITKYADTHSILKPTVKKPTLLTIFSESSSTRNSNINKADVHSEPLAINT